MAAKDPIAFLSYVRTDDEHDRGRITSLRERLEGEVRMHTGQPFRIFQDKRDIKWGEHWKGRIDGTLLSVTFLIPVITPSYFASKMCREEFEKFALREKQLGENRLILPVYYLTADEIEDVESADPISKVITSRNWADWRNLRFKDLVSAEVETAISKMAETIKGAAKELVKTIAASEALPSSPSTAAPTILSPPSKLLAIFQANTPVLCSPKGRFAVDKDARDSLYYAYTRDYDEVVAAEDLSSVTELQELKKSFDRKIGAFRARHRRRISAATKAIESATPKVAPTLTLLIDNSGSMRKKMSDTAAWVTIITKVVESCQIPVEVLGFTTRMWKGGQSRERWLADKKPRNPGRLNDLRHIIYKEFGAPTAKVSNNFALMVREGILKENLDGEAILWAHERAVKQRRAKSIIVVMSDGAPVDDSTLSVNPPTFLEQHLRAAIEWVSRQPGVDLYGLGIEFDLSRYHSRGISTMDTEKLGIDFLEALPQWLGS